MVVSSVHLYRYQVLYEVPRNSQHSVLAVGFAESVTTTFMTKACCVD